MGDQASTPAIYRRGVCPLLIPEPEVPAGGIMIFELVTGLGLQSGPWIICGWPVSYESSC